MKDTVIELIWVLIGFALIIGIVIGVVKCSNTQDSAKWNGGYCECGGHWEYEQAVGHQYSTTYIYRCDNCGKRIEVKSIVEETDNETN